MLSAIAAYVYECCAGVRWNRRAPKTLDQIIEDMERLPKDEFKKLLKVYVQHRMDKRIDQYELCCG